MKTLNEFFDESEVDIKGAAEEEKKELYGYELPKDWKIVLWRDVATPLRQKIKRDHYNGEYPIVAKIPFDKGIIELRDKRETRTDLYISPVGTLVISKINLHQGAVAINDVGTITCTTHYDVYKVNEEKVDIVYFWYLLRSPVFRKIIHDDIKFRGFKKEANFKYLKELMLFLPSLEEQKKIVYVLGTIQKAIEQQDKIIETTKELKKSLMHRLFTRGLDASQPTKQTEIGEVPEHWELIKFNKIITDSKYGLSIRGNKEKKGYPMIRMNNLIDGGLYLDDLQYVEIDSDTFKKFKLEKGDILFNRTNSIDLVGKTTVFDVDGEYVYASYLIRLKLDKSQAFPYFVNYYLNWDITQVRLKSIASKGVSQANISATRLKEFLMVLPPLEEQKQIAQILQTVDRKIEIAKKKKEALQDLFKTMLHKLMTAQIRVKELEISAEKLLVL